MATPAWIVAAVWMLMYFCSAEVGAAPLGPGEVQCLVTENKTGTFHSVPEFEGHDCTVTWSNGSNFTVAHGTEMDKEQVVSSTNRTLVMRVCSAPMHYRRTCNSDGVVIKAICRINCTGIHPSKVDGVNCTGIHPSKVDGGNCTGIHPSKVDGGNSTGIHPSKGDPPRWLVPVLVPVLVVVAVVILALLYVFVFKRCRQKTYDAVTQDNAGDGINMSCV